MRGGSGIIRVAIHFEVEIGICFHHIDDHIEGAHADRAYGGFVDIEVDAMGNDLGVGEFLPDHVHVAPFGDPEISEYYWFVRAPDAADFYPRKLATPAVRHHEDTVLVNITFNLVGFFD